MREGSTSRELGTMTNACFEKRTRKGEEGKMQWVKEGRAETKDTPVGINRRDERRGGPTLFPVPAPRWRPSLPFLLIFVVLFSSSPPLPFSAPRPRWSCVHVKRQIEPFSFECVVVVERCWLSFDVDYRFLFCRRFRGKKGIQKACGDCRAFIVSKFSTQRM